MNHPCLHRFAALLGATLLLGCGGASPPPETSEPEADLCVTDPELAKTRQPSPPATSSCAQWSSKMHVGLQMQNGEPLPADGCADIVRACHLGDEEGCAGCRYHECK